MKPKIVDGVQGEAIVEFREHEIPTPGPGEILVKVEGCGPIGLMQIAILKAAGVVNIIAVDGVETRLALAKEMGIPVEKLVTDHYPLEQYVDAMEKNIFLTGVKIAIVME